MTKLCIIGDPHSHPAYSNDRFTWLGKHLVRTRPDVILCMGDWADLPSLNQHGKLIDSEGLRLRDDRDALHDSLRCLEYPIAEYNRQMRIAHRARYTPRKVYLLGNHEARLTAYEADHPALQGLLSVEWWEPFIESGWEVIPFKQTFEVEGYEACHFFPSGTMGRPIGGKTGVALASRVASDRHVSSIVGHDHRFGIVSLPISRRRIWGINAGCYAHPDYREAWCAQTEPFWDRGVLELDGVKDGDHSRFTWTTQELLQYRYGT